MEVINVIQEFKGEYAFLSNFYPSTFILDGKIYPTVEHYFQAQKTTNKKDFQYVLSATTPGQAKARGRKIKLREDWVDEKVKDDIMFYGVYAKFDQHKDLQYKLISTSTQILKEGNNWGDTYWGVDLRTGIGKNKLGIIIMRCRELFIGGGEFI